jgi:prolyl oligopeptidase
MRRLFPAIAIVAALTGALLAQPRLSATAPLGLPTPPPAAAVRPVTERLYGTAVTDPYRYFENMQLPLVQAFFRNENTYTRAVLDRIGAPREALLRRIHELDNAGIIVSSVQREGDRYFYEKLAPGENDEKLYLRDAAPGSAEHLLVDPDKLATRPNQHFTIDYFLPSLDGKYVAYGISEGGSENATIHIVETSTGRILPDAISRAYFVGATSWRPDDSFYYVRFPQLAPGQPETEKEQNAVTYLHVLGRDPDRDVAIVGHNVTSAVPTAPNDFPLILTTPVSRFALAVLAHGVQNEETIYVAPADSVTAPSAPWKKIIDVGDDVTGFDVRGSTIYLLTHKDAPAFKVVAMSLERPDFATAQTIVAPSREVVEQVGVAADGLYVRSREGGFGRIVRFPLARDGAVNGNGTRVAVPYEGAIDAMTTDPRAAGATFGLTGWTRSLLYYHVDPKGQVADTRLKPPSPVDASAYTSEEVQAPSADGTMIPLSLIYRKGLPLDGSHPAYLEGYGAYGITIEPGFSTTRIAWLERGGVFAVCHTRGGGWYGEGWHRAGMIATKQHTIDDFIACGEWLVAHHYTSPAHLAGEGTSAGGIAIGGAITQAPQLFAAALEVVGVTDALRSEFSANGPPNIPEFGSVKTEAGFKALYAEDAYVHVRDGVAYPAVMAVTGINDPRVPPWEAAKFTARLQAATASGRPILLRVDYNAGHGMLAASREQNEQLLADEYSFLLWQCGDPAFQTLPQRIGPFGRARR